MWTSKDDEFLKAARELGFLTPQQAADCRTAFETVSSTGVKITVGKLARDKGYLSRDNLKAVIGVLRERGVHPSIGPYDILTRLGMGGSGTVYKAMDTRSNRLVALKVLSPALAAVPGQAVRFIRGAELAVKVEHPNVCKTYEVGQDGSNYFLTMEFVQGASLLQMAAGEKRMEEPQALEIVRQAAEGLSACHALGIIHRDVKPHNIIVTVAGVAKIVDLGLAREAASSHFDVTGEGNVVGTPQYMSPEQCSDAKDVDARADIYSLGATFYYALTGMPPFFGDNLFDVLKQQSASQLPNPRVLNPLVSRWAHALIWRMMTKDRKFRPQSMQEVVDAITAIQRSSQANASRVIPLLAGALRSSQPATGPVSKPAPESVPPAVQTGPVAGESPAKKNPWDRLRQAVARDVGTTWGKAVALALLAAVLCAIAALMAGGRSSRPPPMPVPAPAATRRPAETPGESETPRVHTDSANVSPRLLEAMRRDAGSPDPVVRRSIAARAVAPRDVLAQLAADNDPGVRWQVANNPGAPPEILVQLALDSDRDVRLEVARNPHTPGEALQRLASDQAPEVAQQAASALRKRGIAPATSH